MVTTARPPGRRRGARPASAAPTSVAPAGTVPTRTATHLRDAALVVAAGVAGWAAAPWLGYPVLALPALVVGLVGGALLAVAGERTKQRRQLEDRLLEAMAPLLGVRHLDRRIVKLSSWSNRWPGDPARVRIHYAPGAPDTDPTWKSDITDLLASRLLASYEVVRHDQRRCTLLLRRVAEKGPAADPPQAQLRAERAISELIGPTVKVHDVDLAGEDLQSITVTHEAGAKLAASGFRTRIERVISTMMPGRWRAVWDLENDRVRFEVRPSLPSSIWLPAQDRESSEDLLANYRNVKIPCAVDEDGRELNWYPARTPQAMLTGGTGSGKTSMAHALLGQITQYGWPVWVLDAKRVEFLAFRDWPNVQIVAGSIAQQVALVHAAWQLMEDRYQLVEEGKATLNDFEPLVVFLDEFAEFRSNLLEWYAQVKGKGAPSKPPTLAEAASLARKARTARIHLVLSTQRPDTEFLGGEMRDNFGFRMSMGRLSPQGAMMMWESPAVGVTLPRATTGRATATHDDGRPVEVQCYRFPDMAAAEGSEERRLLEAIRPAEARWPRLVIVPPETVDDLDGAPAPELTFPDYVHATWDLAENHPDLDPLAAPAQGSGTPISGRELSSTMASLGINTSGETPRVVDRSNSSAQSAPQVDPSEPDLPEDDYAGYAPAASCAARDLVVGDLIEVEEGSGTWVVVDEAPEEDVITPGLVAVSWRGDGDEWGSLSVSDDIEVAVRRPEEDAA